MRYTENEQDRHYRQEARVLGCTCPELPAHVHLIQCALYRPAVEWLEELDKAHDADDGRPWL